MFETESWFGRALRPKGFVCNGAGAAHIQVSGSCISPFRALEPISQGQRTQIMLILRIDPFRAPCTSFVNQ